MIRRELAVFLVVGCTTVLLDFLVYRGLVLSGWLGVDLAKSLGFIAGAVFAYFANAFWTFQQTRTHTGHAWRFAVLYLLTLLANVAANALMLRVLPSGAAAVQLAFLVATGLSAGLNFAGMKWFVFKTNKDAAPLSTTP